MSRLPKQHQWLSLEDAPRHLLKALELYGTAEIVGPKHNPVIMSWAKELKIDYYKNDEIPWCGLFMAIVMRRAERPVVKDPLRALSWATFGVDVKTPMLGDVLTFTRNGGGHVGLYVFENATHFGVLGGNQGNAVSITMIAKSRLFKVRRPAYNAMPANVRAINLNGAGVPITTNEA
jgi:uncharacterized protein (TIGR02594 family)